jgi:hypothetical protein
MKSASEVAAESIVAFLREWRLPCSHELDLRDGGNVLVCGVLSCGKPVVRRTPEAVS